MSNARAVGVEEGGIGVNCCVSFKPVPDEGMANAGRVDLKTFPAIS